MANKRLAEIQDARELWLSDWAELAIEIDGENDILIEENEKLHTHNVEQLGDIARLMKQVSALKKAQEWREGPPEESELVNVIYRNEVTCGFWIFESGDWENGIEDYPAWLIADVSSEIFQPIDEPILQWQPLPSPPEVTE